MKAVSGHTRPFAVLGHPIGHTLSPVLHNAAFAALGMDAVYLAFDVAPERLKTVLPAMADLGFGGANLTVPLKEVAFRELARLHESARLLGAVNTVAFGPDGLLTGHNTDGRGFLQALEEAFGVGVAGRCLFVFGSGGAGRAAAIAAATHGASAIALADVDQPRADRLAGEIRALAPGVSATVVACEPGGCVAAAQAADLVVQATPVGMRAEDSAPLPAAAFRPGHLAFDLVYNLPETVFMRTARAAGARAANGLGMLLHQGAAAFSIWTGRPAPVAVMRAALEQALYGGTRQGRPG
jgi:shikimate dehydrogenase